MLGPDPAPRGTARALEAPAQAATQDTALRKQHFPCGLGISVFRNSPSVLGHSPEELWCRLGFGKGLGQEISTPGCLQSQGKQQWVVAGGQGPAPLAQPLRPPRSALSWFLMENK